MNRRHFLASTSAAVAAASLPGCNKRSGAGAAQPVLKVFTMANSLAEDLPLRFEKAFDCALRLATFDSNVAMLAELEAGTTGCDLLVPSSASVHSLRRGEFLQPLDHSKLPNLEHVDPSCLAKALDPKMEVSVPYMLAPAVLGYLASKVPDPIQSWSLLARPGIKGHATLLNDMREVLGAALKYLGHSINSVDPEQLGAAREVVIGWKANIAKFESKEHKAGLASGEFYLVHGHADDLIPAARENDDIRIFIPREGAALSCHDLCIPKSASHPELAHDFINFLNDPEVAAENMEWTGSRAPNRPAYRNLSDGFRSNRLLFPPPALFAKCEVIDDLGDQLPLWTTEWDKVKVA